MNTISQTITGTALIAFGLYMIFSIIDKTEDWPWNLIFGIFFIVIGWIVRFIDKKINPNFL